MGVLIASAPSAYWYTTRGAGIVALLLLTASLVLGIVDLSRWHSERWPRFLLDGAHRTVSLLALAVVAIHVVTTLLDGYTQIGIRDAFVPFLSSYRPIWVGLGALAFDLLLAVALTSVFRQRIGHRTWRAVHWASYACWPVALIHELGSGTDSTSAWMLAISAACLLTVLAAVGWRILGAWPAGDRRRALALSAIATALLAAVIWTAEGPLGSNWAARAGTPTALLTGSASGTAAAASKSASTSTTTLPIPFTSELTGSVTQHPQSSQGLVLLDIRATLKGSVPGNLEIQIQGQPLAGGGVSMANSEVTIGPPGQPLLYRGRLTSLQGGHLLATVSDQGASAQLDVQVSVDQSSQQLTGTVSAQPGGSS